MPRKRQRRITLQYGARAAAQIEVASFLANRRLLVKMSINAAPLEPGPARRSGWFRPEQETKFLSCAVRNRAEPQTAREACQTTFAIESRMRYLTIVSADEERQLKRRRLRWLRTCMEFGEPLRVNTVALEPRAIRCPHMWSTSPPAARQRRPLLVRRSP